LFGIVIPLAENMQIGAAFMAISLVRQYIFRRLFNRPCQRPPTQRQWGLRGASSIKGRPNDNHPTTSTS
jgi:hypothetical protein